jgi:hypothetical protein
MRNLIKSVLAATAALAVASVAHAATPESNATFYAGHADVSNGFDNRDFVGAFVNSYSDSGLGVHGDFAYVDREDNGFYGAFGVSYQVTDNLRPKIMLGTSSNNDNILPEAYASASVEYKADGGWIVTPGVAYRKYRTGGEEVQPSVDVTKYTSIPGDTGGYYAVQGRVTGSFNDSDEDGWSVGLGVQSVRSNGFTVGLNGEFGHMTYDSVIGIGVATDYWAVRPSVGFRVDKHHEVFVRGEYADTDFYKVEGAMIGVKYTY